MTSYVIPIIFLTVLALAACRKKNAYSVFVDGSKTALSLMAERSFPTFSPSWRRWSL